MKKIKIIIFSFFLILQNCIAQKNKSPEFTYQTCFFENEKIVESFTYDSNTGIYEYQLINPGFEKVVKTVKITLSLKAKKEIFDLYEKLKPKNLQNCMFENNQKTYTSKIRFSNINLPNSCNTDIKDQQNYKKITDKLYDFFSSSFAYREMFPEEFIRK